MCVCVAMRVQFSLYGTLPEQEQQHKVVKELEAAIYQRKKSIGRRRAGNVRPSIALSKDWSFMLTPGSTASQTKDKDETDSRADRRSFLRRSSTGSMLQRDSQSSGTGSSTPDSTPSRPVTPRRRSTVKDMRRSITGVIAPLAQFAAKVTQPEGLEIPRSPSVPLAPSPLISPLPSRSTTPVLKVPTLLVSHPSIEEHEVPDGVGQKNKEVPDQLGPKAGESTRPREMSQSSVKFDLPLDSKSEKSAEHTPKEEEVVFLTDTAQPGLSPALSSDDTAAGVALEDRESVTPVPGDVEDVSSIGGARSWSFVDLDIAVTVNIKTGQCCLYPEPLPKETRYIYIYREREIESAHCTVSTYTLCPIHVTVFSLHLSTVAAMLVPAYWY